MTVNMVPQLVTIEGEYDDSFMGYDPEMVAELLGIDYDDAFRLTDHPLNNAEIAYLSRKYPEYMGVWPLLAKAGAVLVKGGIKIGKGIAKAFKKKKAKKTQAAADTAAAQQAARAKSQKNYEAVKKKKEAEQKKLYQAAVEKKKKEDDQKKLMMIGLPIIGIAALLMLKK